MASNGSTGIRGDANSMSGDGSFRYQGGTTNFGFNFGSAEVAKEFFILNKDTEEKRIAAERETKEKAIAVDEKRVTAEEKRIVAEEKRIAAEKERIEAERQTDKERNWLIGGTLVLVAASMAIKAYRDKKLLESNLVNGKRIVETVSPAGTKAAAATVLFTATGVHQSYHDPPHVRVSPVPTKAAATVATVTHQQPDLK